MSEFDNGGAIGGDFPGGNIYDSADNHNSLSAPDKNYGFDVYLWGLDTMVGSDRYANFVPLSDIKKTAIKLRVYGLKPETVELSAEEGFNNSMNNSELFFLQFSIMVKSLTNIKSGHMALYRQINNILRMPFKYFTYYEDVIDVIYMQDWASTNKYFDRVDIPKDHAMRFEVLDKSINHDFKTGTKTMTIKIRNYKPFRQKSNPLTLDLE